MTLQEHRDAAVKAFASYLVEREKLHETRGNFGEWAKQQHSEMQAEHAWLNAKQAYEVALYSTHGWHDPEALPS